MRQVNGRSLFRTLGVLLFLGFLYLLISIRQEVDIYDEGVVVYGAERVLKGEIPYRDFWTIYSPGQFYTLAGVFKLFGISILTERVWDILLRSLLSLTVFLITIRLTSLRFALLVWLLANLWLGYFGYFGYPTFPALLFSMLSIFCLLALFSGRSFRMALFVGGVTAAIATLYRLDSGLYIIFSEILVAAPFIFFNLAPREENLLNKFLCIGKTLLLYLLGVGAILLPVFLYFASVVPFNELVNDLVVFPLKVFPEVRSLPYPKPLPNPSLFLTDGLASYLWNALDRVPFYFPFLVYFATIVFVVSHARKGEFDEKKFKLWGITLLVVFGLFSFNQVRVRSDLLHLPPVLISAIPLFAFLFSTVLEKPRKIRFFVSLFCLITIVSLLVKPVYNTGRLMAQGFLQPVVSDELERAKCIPVPPDQIEAIRYLQSKVLKDEKIFVGNSKHNQIFNSDVAFYFLAERHSVTKYHELHPGCASVLSVQREIVEDLKRNEVNYVVLFSGYANRGETTGVMLLDNFLQANYRFVQNYGDYQIWKKH